MPRSPDLARAAAPATIDLLIVSYNTRDLLADCLESIDRCRPAELDLRVHVLDNASADGSADLVAERFPWVRLVRSTENLGFGRANNELLRDADGDYVVLLNPDTVLREDIVTPAVELLERRPDVALVAPRLVSPDGSLQLSSQRFPTPAFELALALRGTKLGRVGPLWDSGRIVRETREEDLVDDEAPRESDFVWATCWVLRGDEVRAWGLFDETFPLYDEDLDYCYRLRLRGRKAVYMPAVSLVHVGGASSSSERKRQLLRVGRSRYYRRHHGRAAALVVDRVVPAVAALRRVRRRLG